MDAISKTYQGFSIRVDPAQMWFEINGVPATMSEDECPLMRKTFSSYSRATEAVDKFMIAERRKLAGHFAIALPLVTLEGGAFTCTGINRTTLDLLGSPTKDQGRFVISRPRSDAGFPDTPEVRALIARRAAAAKIVDRADKILYKLQLSSGRGYGRIPPEEYGEEIEALKKRHEIALKAATEQADTILAATVDDGE